MADQCCKRGLTCRSSHKIGRFHRRLRPGKDNWAEQASAKDAELTRVQDTNARLWETLRQLRRAQFGRKSEKLDPDQLSLAMEETE